jgi:hypothetical protein
LAVEWYSATTFNFGRSDTIDKIIARYKPSYIFMVLGLNELYAKDLKARKIAANQLAEKIKGIPYTWIGPANWQEDFGINKVYESSAEPGAYFMSKNLTLPRSKDGRHPDNKGYRLWMDSIAAWVQTSAKYKIKLKVPVKRARPYLSPVITICVSALLCLSRFFPISFEAILTGGGAAQPARNTTVSTMNTFRISPNLKQAMDQ